MIIPQYEHGRLAGTLASLWGNENFDKPKMDFDAFVKGVTLHDWHYGRVDNVEIGQASDAKWLSMVQRGVALSFDDPITEIVVKKHIARLLRGHSSVVIKKMLMYVETHIEFFFRD